MTMEPPTVLKVHFPGFKQTEAGIVMISLEFEGM